MRPESISSRFPLLCVFGEQRHQFLANGAASTATTEQRLRSVWPFLVRRVLSFSKTLAPRDRANFDAEDILAQLVAKIAERDPKYNAERGSYVTFVATVADHELEGIRDRASTIQAPRNSSCRIKAYRKREANGTLTERCRHSANDIARTKSGTHDLEFADTGSSKLLPSPLTLLIAQESSQETTTQLKEALASIDPVDAEVLVRRSGLFGHEIEPAGEIAPRVGLSEGDVKAAYVRARAALRRRLIANRSPLVPEALRNTG
jgi:DNA-directed RNA polymerase specialized sigma24 family protein